MTGTPRPLPAPFGPRDRPLVGMVHLPPTAGPRAPGVAALIEHAVTDARRYAEAGFDAVLVENLGDAPWPKDGSAPHVVAAMTRVVAAVRDAVDLPVGVNVLRNDALAALGICHATGAAFLRVNVLIGAAVTDQGIIEGCSHALATYRDRLGADDVLLLADIDVKHAAPLARRPLDELAADAVHRAGADILLVTGAGTNQATDLAHVGQVAAAADGHPVWVASGVTKGTVREVLQVADGVIVGSAVKTDGRTSEPVDASRARAFVEAARRGRS